MSFQNLRPADELVPRSIAIMETTTEFTRSSQTPIGEAHLGQRDSSIIVSAKDSLNCGQNFRQAGAIGAVKSEGARCWINASLNTGKTCSVTS